MGEKDVIEWDLTLTEGMGGAVHFGRMNMKQGKPTTFVALGRDMGLGGRRQNFVFALPGNLVIVSASVCGKLLVRVRPAPQRGRRRGLGGRNCKAFIKRTVDCVKVHKEVMATITSDIKVDHGHLEYRWVERRRASCAGSETQQYRYLNQGTGRRKRPP